MGRISIVVWVLVAGIGPACHTADSELAGGEDSAPMDGNRQPDPSEETCVVDSDCRAAASTCCECPSFAVSNAGLGDGCQEVNCEGLEEGNCSTLAAPVCVSGQCELVCQPLVLEVDEVCDGGFLRDEFGCATKTCAGLDSNAECAVDADCTRVKADCCGCEAGGQDTAVPNSEANSFSAGLGCTGNESCPGVFVCEPDVIPQCSSGTCVLAAPPNDTGPNAPTPCGLSTLPPCPTGEVCVLNDPEANDDGEFGVGVCRPE